VCTVRDEECERGRIERERYIRWRFYKLWRKKRDRIMRGRERKEREREEGKGDSRERGRC